MSTPAPQSTGARRRWVRHLASGQESGLLLVIGLMVLGLFLAAPVRRRSAQVVLREGDTLRDVAGGFEVRAGGSAPQTYHAGDGWTKDEVVRSYPAGTTCRPDATGLVVTRPGRDPVRLEGAWIAETGPDGAVSARQVRLVQNLRFNTFFNTDNLLSVLTSATYYAIMAVGITGVIVMGGIDLSVGSIYCLAAVVGAMMLRAMGVQGGALAGTPGWLVVPLTFAVCAGVGAACGLANGLGTVLLRVHPFIITLGTMSIFRGLAYLFSDGESVTGFPPQISAGFVRASVPSPFGPVEVVPLVLTLVVTVLGAVLFSRTVFGRRTYAIGGNETAAKYAGVPVGRIKVWLFVLCGAAAGLAALIQLGRYGAADSTAGRGDELRVIASAVVGGASLAGGRGSAVGAVLGAVIIALISNATIILDVPPSWTDVVLGMTIVVAVVVDQTKQRLARARA